MILNKKRELFMTLIRLGIVTDGNRIEAMQPVTLFKTRSAKIRRQSSIQGEIKRKNR